MDAVCFDMDGVLVDSEDYWVEWEEDELFPAVVPDQHVGTDEITGMNYREIYDYLAGEYDVAVDRETFLGMYRDASQDIYGHHVALLSGFPALAADLRGRGAVLSIVSSSPRDWIDRVTERFSLGGAFDAVVSAEDIDAPGKPEPHIYEHAAAELGVAPADCVAVEDSTHGATSAARAGMVVVGYRTAVNADTDLSAADVVAEGPEELREALLAQFGGR